jgi:hypothetical protein
MPAARSGAFFALATLTGFGLIFDFGTPFAAAALGSGLLLCELPQLTLLVTKRLSGVAGRNPIK